MPGSDSQRPLGGSGSLWTGSTSDPAKPVGPSYSKWKKLAKEARASGNTQAANYAYMRYMQDKSTTPNIRSQAWRQQEEARNRALGAARGYGYGGGGSGGGGGGGSRSRNRAPSYSGYDDRTNAYRRQGAGAGIFAYGSGAGGNANSGLSRSQKTAMDIVSNRKFGSRKPKDYAGISKDFLAKEDAAKRAAMSTLSDAEFEQYKKHLKSGMNAQSAMKLIR
jgi:hypothetical protein